MAVHDNEKVRSFAFSIAEAAEKLGPWAEKDGLDETVGTSLRSALKDLRAIDSDLWAIVETLEMEEV